jgi:hypothetical protein
MVLLGQIAQRIRGKVNFDGRTGSFIQNEKASKMLNKEYPEGWILK